jgi:hypothetical protein
LILEFKTGTFVMPLVEEKLGAGFAVVCSDKRCVLCEKCFTPRRNETATFATPLYNRAPAGIENNMVPLAFSRDPEF